MLKTTVYLPAGLKRRLERLAERRGESVAALIREAITRFVDAEVPRSPRLGLFASGDPTLAQRVDEELAKGFGRDG